MGKEQFGLWFFKNIIFIFAFEYCCAIASKDNIMTQ